MVPPDSIKTILLLVGLLLPALALADNREDNYEDLVHRAFDSINHDVDLDWAHTETSSTQDVVRVGHYDPRRPDNDRWRLVSVDGRDPTNDQIDDYLEQKRRHSPKDEDDRDTASMVRFETLRLVEETAARWIFSFVPTDDQQDALIQELDGRLSVVKDGHYVEYITLRNDKPIKPTTGVKISEFLMTFTFEPATKEGPIVLVAADVEIKGRAMFVIRIDETETFRFSEFEFVGN
jgi:hypothetical protein